MTAERSNLFSNSSVPDLGVTAVCADSKVLALLAPANTSDLVIHRHLTELVDLASVGRPNVHTSVQADSQHVLRTPVDEVQVEVILKLWGIQYLEWNLVDLACLDRLLSFFLGAVIFVLQVVPQLQRVVVVLRRQVEMAALIEGVASVGLMILQDVAPAADGT